MDDRNTSTRRKVTRKKRQSKTIYLTGLVLLLLFSALFYINRNSSLFQGVISTFTDDSKIEKQSTSEPALTSVKVQPSLPTSKTDIANDQNSPEQDFKAEQTTTITPPPESVKPEPVKTATQILTKKTLTAAPATQITCKSGTKVVRDFFHHLDRQEYMRPYLDGQRSESYFIPIIQKLADNPPVVSGETSDLFTILQNTAHFFRIIGKQNIQALKAILHNEKKYSENVLLNFYTITGYAGCTQSEFGLDIPKNALYDYAGFFLNTVGGRLYLFRRESLSRMTVIYYSILIIQEANREGRNAHGIDIRPSVKLLIPEIEENGSKLFLRDRYLEKLYEIESHFQ